MAQQPQPGSPEWWRDRLLKQLQTRAAKVVKLESYYAGKHPLPEPPKGLNQQVFEESLRAFRTLAELGPTNWVKLVADAPSERLAVIGFRFGDATAGWKDDLGAWSIWQRNHLDADSALVHDNALQTGNSFVLVWRDAAGKAVITPEHSGEMIVAYVPGDRRERAAALKSWMDDTGRRMATLYLPGEIYKWQTKSTRPGYATANFDDGPQWQERKVAGEEWPLKHKLGVPVVELRTNPGLAAAPYGGGCGEFEGVLSIQNRINKTIFDRLVTAEAQAFRQRYTIGWEVPIDPTTKQPDPRAVAKAGAARLLTFPDGVKVGEFTQADFKSFIEAVEADVRAMAAITKTPPQYLLGAMANISGEALTAAESGLVAKTIKHREQYSESWEEVMQLALAAEGNPRSADVQTMVLWRDPQFRSFAEVGDYLVKLQSIGVPEEILWSMVPGTSQQDLHRWLTARAAAGFLNDTSTPAPAPTPPPPAAATPLSNGNGVRVGA